MDFDIDPQNCLSYIRFEILRAFSVLVSSSMTLTISFLLKAHVAKVFDMATFLMKLVQGGGSA